jgi:hypothetical protein
MLLVPVGALKLASLWFSSSPSLASVDAAATTSPDATTAVQITPASRTPEEVKRQTAASTYAESMRAKGFGATPFYYEPREDVVTPEPEPEPGVVQRDPDAPTFSVQVIMASDVETKALIDGKIYRVGDEFREGWIVAEIDSFARTVTIADPATGRTSKQSVRFPGER